MAAVRTSGGEAEGYLADLSELAACARLARDVAARGDLQVLVNNAAVGFGAPGAGRSLSADGFELRWAVNYLAPVALTRGLLDTFRAAAPSQVVNVGSVGQAPIAFDDLRMDRDTTERSPTAAPSSPRSRGVWSWPRSWPAQASA